MVQMTASNSFGGRFLYFSLHDASTTSIQISDKMSSGERPAFVSEPYFWRIDRSNLLLSAFMTSGLRNGAIEGATGGGVDSSPAVGCTSSVSIACGSVGCGPPPSDG